MTLLGWSFDESREFFTRDELEQLFTLDKLSKSPAVFDYKKLDWFNGMYIRKLTPEDLCDRLIPFMQKASLIGIPAEDADKRKLLSIIPLIRERLTVLSECAPWTGFFFMDVTVTDPTALIPKKASAETARKILETLKNVLPELLDKPETEIEEGFKRTAETLGVKLGDLLMPLRVALTGTKVSPPLIGSMHILGWDTISRRLDAAIALLDKKV